VLELKKFIIIKGINLGWIAGYKIWSEIDAKSIVELY